MPTSAQLDYLRSIDSPTVANAIERFAIRDRTDGYLGGAIRCQFPGLGVMVGRALTVTMDSPSGAAADRDGYWRMWQALEAAPSPSVLVIADGSGQPTRCAYVGEVMATMALRLGAVGLVTDAGVRDLAEVEALGFHLFAAHVVVSHGNFRVVDVGSDVTLDGQLVRTGDLLHGDRNGIVLVPESTLDELPRVVDQIRASEAATIADATSPGFSVQEARRRAGY